MKTKSEILQKWLDQCFETGTLHLDTIGKIEEAMEEYTNQSKWIAVEESPEHSKDVLVVTNENGPEFHHVAQCHSGRWYTHSEELHYVTKWQELPQ